MHLNMWQIYEESISIFNEESDSSKRYMENQTEKEAMINPGKNEKVYKEGNKHSTLQSTSVNNVHIITM